MTDRSKEEAATAKTGKGSKCPICGKATVHAVRPFCSARCAEIDLGRWVSGSYVIAGGLTDADEDGDDAAAGRGRDDEV